MAENNTKINHPEKPVEKHNSAAWANVEEQEQFSDVTIPGEMQVMNAKEYVDENQK